jgi:glycosyltransferase involved in cell wall biosynthesis
VTSPAGTPRVSICILSYNYARFIGQAITSCVEQRPGDHVLEEVVVVDDSSTDSTRDVCRRFGDVRLVELPHRGYAANLSSGVEHCRGDWVALLDADDWFVTHKLREVAPHLDHPVLLLRHMEHVVDVDGSPMRPEPHPGGNTSTLVVNRAAALELLPVTNELFFHVFADLGRCVDLDVPLTHYRVHDGSMTDRRDPARYQSYMAGVCAAVTGRLVQMSRNPPAWAEADELRRLAERYCTRGGDHRRRAAR